MEDSPVRVLFLTPYFRPYLGGIERAIEQLTFQIQKSGEVEAVGVLTTKYSFPRVAQPDWADRETTDEGIDIFRLSGYPRRSIPLYSVPLVWFSPFRLRHYLNEFNPNVIHFVGDGWFWGHIWAWFWFRRRARFVFTPSFHTLPISRWWLRPFNMFLCNVVDRVVALTRLEGGRVRRAYMVPKSKQSVIGWGATPPDPEAWSAAEPSDKSSPDSTPATDNIVVTGPANYDGAITVLCVGRLGQHKGQMWLLSVYQEATARFHKPARLVLIGRDEGDEAILTRAVQEMGLEGQVILTGELSDSELNQWYAQSDIFALFSHYEAFGLVFFEAMAHGLPLLTHDVGANRELLVRGAEVVPTFDRAAALEALVRLVNDDKYRAELGEDAQKYALSEFTWAATADKYISEYKSTT